MRWCDAVRVCLGTGFVAIGAVAQASGPDNQFGYQLPIVRIFYTRDGNFQFNGTGTVIANHNVDGQGYFCVLTADHVIAAGGPSGAVRNGLGIGFGMLKDVNSVGFLPNNGNPMGAGLLARLGPADANGNALVDMALLKVHYGEYNQTFDQYAMPIGTDAFVAGELFSSAGYGRVGQRLLEANPRPGRPVIPVGALYWNGFNGVASDQTQRFYYNSVERTGRVDDNGLAPRGIPGNPYDPDRSVEPYPGSEPPDGIENNPRQGYAYDGLEYTLDAPTSPHAAVGEGVGYGGDSGAPYMYWDGERQVIGGIHTYGYYLNDQFGKATQMKLWGMEGGGVNLTQDYRNWISRSCDAVPEPSTVACLALGVLALAGRRRPWSR